LGVYDEITTATVLLLVIRCNTTSKLLLLEAEEEEDGMVGWGAILLASIRLWGAVLRWGFVDWDFIYGIGDSE
jgi:hypothetical protein